MDSKTFRPQSASHPGEIVSEYLESFGWTQQDLARRTGLTPKTISELCNGKTSVSPEAAIAFEKVLGRPSHFWMNLQSRYEEARVRTSEVGKLHSWIEWAKGFPLREMKKLKWIPESHSVDGDVQSLLHFMGVSSPESMHSVWDSARVSFRQTRKIQVNEYSIYAWIRAAEMSAIALETQTFDETQLIRSIAKLRQCTRLPIDQGLQEAQKITAICGIASVVVPPLANTGISGLARWTSKLVILAISLRYKFDDQIWFTYFHEIGHLLLHRKQQYFILDNAEGDLSDGGVDPSMQKYEDEANRFAADVLIPPEDLQEFISADVFTNDAIQDFSDRISIAPGIVVGRLQRESILKPHQGNALKQRANLHHSPESEE